MTNKQRMLLQLRNRKPQRQRHSRRKDRRHPVLIQRLRRKSRMREMDKWRMMSLQMEEWKEWMGMRVKNLHNKSTILRSMRVQICNN